MEIKNVEIPGNSLLTGPYVASVSAFKIPIYMYFLDYINEFLFNNGRHLMT